MCGGAYVCVSDLSSLRHPWGRKVINTAASAERNACRLLVDMDRRKGGSLATCSVPVESMKTAHIRSLRSPPHPCLQSPLYSMNMRNCGVQIDADVGQLGVTLCSRHNQLIVCTAVAVGARSCSAVSGFPILRRDADGASLRAWQCTVSTEQSTRRTRSSTEMQRALVTCAEW